MKAAILAGGGKQQNPSSSPLPKFMYKIADKPLLEWQLRWLKVNGVSDIVLLTGRLPNETLSKAKSLAKAQGMGIELSVEEKPLGTGGALRLSEKFFENESSFLLVNGDVLTNLNAKRLLLGSAVACIALVPLRSSYGIVELKGDKIIDFKEKPLLNDHWINAGVYLLSNSIFDYLPTKGDLERSVLSELSWKGLLKGRRFKGVYWRSIESLRDIIEAEKDFKKGIKVDNLR